MVVSEEGGEVEGMRTTEEGSVEHRADESCYGENPMVERGGGKFVSRSKVKNRSMNSTRS